MELADHHDHFEFSVESTFMMMTPPPSSEIPMPIVTARSPAFTVTFVENWLAEPYFAVSIQRRFPGKVCLYGFVASILPDQRWVLEHFPKERVFESPSDLGEEITGAVANRHMLYGLLHLLMYTEKRGKTEPFAPHEQSPGASVMDARDDRTLDSLPAPGSRGGR
ncbi:MAG: hypothetical protein IT581_11660 [Verrucomicrobiales bacterium]|nr:hypothetical protein [Verrucomicrobiales bacterium]